MKAFAALCAAVAALAFSAAPAHAQRHDYHASAPPDPATIDTNFDLRDVYGRAVRSIDLRGRWTLLYFGYARCTTACPIAIPTIMEAARRLNDRGIPTRAAFVDIDAPPLGVRQLRTDVSTAASREHEGHDLAEAARELQANIGSGLLVLTGTRGQVNAAVARFQVLREHTPPRAQESGHSMNHSTLVYIMAPNGKVEGYLYHTAETDQFVRFIRQRSRDRD